MTRLIYLASPLSGDIESNLAYARKCLRHALFVGDAPFVPHLLYTQVLDDTKPAEREEGMRAGAAWIAQCRAFVAYLDRGWSRGMLEEKRFAQSLGIPVEERRLFGTGRDEQLTCRAAGCLRSVPYVDWTVCEEHLGLLGVGR